MPYFTKCVSLGEAGAVYYGTTQSFQSRVGDYAATNTGVVRLWARWDILQPSAGTPVGVTPPGWQSSYGQMSPQQALQTLDEQVQAANAAGRVVILCLNRIPPWANASTRATGPKYSGQEDYFAFPDDKTTSGPWAAWVVTLLLRYCENRSDRAGIVTAVEVLNEPNHSMWPQRVSSTSPQLASACAAATLMMTAVTVRNYFAGTRPFIAGPGTLDEIPPIESNTRSSYFEFTSETINALKSANFADDNTIWTQHNYADVTFDQGGGTMVHDRDSAPEQQRSTLRSAVVSVLLAQSGLRLWGGPGSGKLWLTEGGLLRPRLTSLPWQGPGAFPWSAGASDDQKQAALLTRANSRIMLVPAISLFTNYLFATDPAYDSGLCDAAGAPRQPAYSAWSGF